MLEPLGTRDFLIVGGKDAGSARPFSRDALARICQDAQLGFVVANIDVAAAAGRREWPRQGQFVWLYDCKAFRPLGNAT